MLLPSVNAKTQHNHIKKGWLWQRYAACAVVIAGVEMQLVNATAVIIALQHGRIAAAIVVGDNAVEQLKLIAYNAIQLDFQLAARATMSGIQYVCG